MRRPWFAASVLLALWSAAPSQAASVGARDVSAADAVAITRSRASSAIRLARRSGLPAWAVRRVARTVRQTVGDMAPTVALGRAEVDELNGDLLVFTPAKLGLEASIQHGPPRPTGEVPVELVVLGGTGVSGPAFTIVGRDVVLLDQGERKIEFTRQPTPTTLSNGSVAPPNAWVMHSTRRVRGADGRVESENVWERSRVLTTSAGASRSP